MKQIEKMYKQKLFHLENPVLQLAYKPLFSECLE